MTDEALNIASPQVTFQRFKLNNIHADFTKIVEINVEESLDYPGITGRLFLQDYDNIKIQTGIIGSDPIDLEVKFRNQKLSLTSENYVVTNGHGDEITNVSAGLYNATAIGFETRWSVNAFNLKVSRAYTKANAPFENDGQGWRISDIIKDLVEICGGHPSEEIWFETEGILERFITPKWTVMESINYLLSLAKRQSGETGGVNKSGGYMLWTNIMQNDYGLNEVNFAPIDFMMHEEEYYNVLDETVSTTDLNDETVLTTWTGSQHNPRRIHKIEVSKSFDSMKAVDSGVCNSTLAGFDFDKGEVINANNNAVTYVHNHITEGIPLNKVYTHRKFANLKSSISFPNTDKVITPANNMDFDGTLFIDGKAATKTSLLMADLITLELVTEGDPESKKIGRRVRVIVPKSKGGGEENKQLSGLYIVRDNVHVIRSRYYANSVTVMREGYRELLSENGITWDMSADPDATDGVTDSQLNYHIYGVEGIGEDPGDFDLDFFTGGDPTTEAGEG